MSIAYNLSNGKTIFLSFEEWLDLTDEKIQEYLAFDRGLDIDDPFTNLTHLNKNSKQDVPDINDAIEPLDDQIIDEIKKEIDKDI